ncbi:MAG TPA: adenosine deaminase family protein [bacterium]|nr:adenosine deaminase family protein [bacterium]HOL46773.1 adenosine deaminase family protein [bacterium]HPQ17728.1 adenosine deaminase family protein [bacterium]
MYKLEFLKKIPKTDLHLHLDGSLRIPTLIELAKENNVQLPSYTVDGLKQLVFKDRYNSLAEYLQGFIYTVATLQTAEALERVAYELAWDNINEGVRYIEVRFAPQLHINKNLSFEQILEAVNKGLKRAETEYNSSEKIKNNEEPPFHYGIIVCSLRMFMPMMSEYYRKLFEVHKYSTQEEIFALASIELAKATEKLLNTTDIPVVGFDLAGQENGYPAGTHKTAYEICHNYFLKKTVHAGEAYGAESIFQAITHLKADRIGHGFYLFDENKIESKKIVDKQKYIRDLANYIADRRITIEVCLTSNLQTNPNLKDIKEHTFKKMLEHGLSVTICTDNMLMSNTTVTKEIKLAVDNFNIPLKKLRDIIIYGFKRSFFPGDYMTKRKYCRQIIDYYDKIQKEFYPDA